jgi:hypothetical protein
MWHSNRKGDNWLALATRSGKRDPEPTPLICLFTHDVREQRHREITIIFRRSARFV